MLAKLIKYELGATARVFLPLYAIILIVSLLNSLFLSFRLTMMTVGASAVLVSLFLAMAVIVIVIAIQRYHRNLFGDEGYLTNTLPVRSSSLIWSKLLTTLLWIVLGCGVGCLSALMLLVGSQRDTTALTAVVMMGDGLSQLMTLLFAGEERWFFLLLGLCIFLSLCCEILQVYFCLSLAQLEPFRRYRTAAALLWYLGINFVLSLVSAPLQGRYGGMEVTAAQMGGVLWMAFAVDAVLAVVFFQGCRVILEQRLNLE